MSHPIRSVREAQQSLDAARIDLQRLLWAQDLRDKLRSTDPLHKQPQLLQFYITIWPQHISDTERKQRWSDCLDTRVEELVAYIQSVEQWVERMRGRAVRCALPKKRQRELGLLPSVEDEIAIREGRT